MNRIGLGLAVGAGYLLGRTKKLKFAIGVGTLVAGKKLPLSPKAIGELVQKQLLNNPQFKEIGDQLRGDMQGVGKAASGALLERGLNRISDRLHDRTLGVQDKLSGVQNEVGDQVGGLVPGQRSRGQDDEQDEYDERDARHDDERDADHDEREHEHRNEHEDAEERPEKKQSSRRPQGSRSSGPRNTDQGQGPRGAQQTRTAEKAAAKKAPAKKAPAKKTAAAAKSTAAKKTTATAKTAARRPARTKGGRDDG